MRVRHTLNGKSTGNARGELRDTPGSGPVSSSECLDYIAAMAQELKAISANANCKTLAGLLDLAYREAVQRRRAHPQKDL